MTETAAFADLVLPAAIWGEKTGALLPMPRPYGASLRARCRSARRGPK